jgi:hypothetical protein
MEEESDIDFLGIQEFSIFSHHSITKKVQSLEFRV